MSVTAPADLLAQLRWRYAVKQFDRSKPLTSGEWNTLAEALVLSPSSYGLQPWKFVVITDAALKTALRAVSWNQAQVEDCSHHVVFTAKETITEADLDRFIAATAAARGQTIEKLGGYRGFMQGDLIKGPRSKVIAEWATRQCYIALGNLMTSAAMIGVDACPMEGFDPPAYDRILGLTGYRSVVACALGHRDAADKYATAAKVRYPVADVVEMR